MLNWRGPDARVRVDRVPDGDSVRIERITGPGDDLDAVCALEAESFTNPWTREMLVRELRSSDVTRIYVLRLPDGGIAAFCTCWLISDELHVNTIAVRPSERRRGLGLTLMRHVMRVSAAAGARRATLEVRRSNEAARRLYERLGFRVAAVRPHYYTKPEEDALILWCESLQPADMADSGPEIPTDREP
jgi:ribosomal-protein-alanine N-acetyltransferase